MTKTDRLAEWLDSAGMLMESQIVGSGLSSALNELLRTGRADMTAHPTVKDRNGVPVAAVVPRNPLGE